MIPDLTGRRRILVAVKSYPRPSRTWQETDCVAGITEDRQWIRLYPVMFRQLPPEQQFSKYEWIEANLARSPRDYRAETVVPDHDSIKVLGKMKDWSHRRSFILPLLDPSLEAIQATSRSLGLIKPREVLDFEIEPDTGDWTPEQKRSLLQGTLFAPAPAKPLEKIPFKFYYRFRCHDESCRGHRLQLIDWEVFQAYRSWRHSAGSEHELMAKLKDKFLTDFMAGRDTHFFLGTALQQHHYKTFMVIGVFYPPSKEYDQMSWTL